MIIRFLLVFGLCVSALSSALAAPSKPAELAVGVVDTAAFRLTDAKGYGLRSALGPSRFETLSLAEQIDGLGYTAFHFRVFADPKPGRFARGNTGAVPALRQPGLKVIPASGPDADARCYTLMTCLIALDRLSQARPGHVPWTVVIEPTALQPAVWRGRWRDYLLGPVSMMVPRRDETDAPPSLVQVQREVDYVLSRDGGARLRVLIRNHDGVTVLSGDEPDWRLAAAVMADKGAVVVKNADWPGDGDTYAVGPIEAARAGVDAILLAQHAAR